MLSSSLEINNTGCIISLRTLTGCIGQKELNTGAFHSGGSGFPDVSLSDICLEPCLLLQQTLTGAYTTLKSSAISEKTLNIHLLTRPENILSSSGSTDYKGQQPM